MRSEALYRRHQRVGIMAGLLGFVSLVPPSVANVASSSGPPRPAPHLIASPESGWPQWRGPRRDGVCDETGLRRSWPAEGPPRLWSATGIGRGYSTVTIAGGQLYITGDLGDELRIFAFDLNGTKLWEASNGAAWTGAYPGARASCTVSDGRIYHLNAHGRVACLDATTGRELWAFLMFERFGGKNITWAISENLLVDGNRLFLTPGGRDTLMAAVDKRTGETLWKTGALRLGSSPNALQQRLAEPPGSVDNCSYSSPILLDTGGRKQIVNCSLRHAFGVDAETGELLWTQPMATRYSVIASTPLLIGDSIFVTAPHGSGGKLWRLPLPGQQTPMETVWTTSLDTCHGGVVLANNLVIGSWYGREKGWAAVAAETGRVQYRRPDLDQGSVLWADGRLYCLSQSGEMALLIPREEEFEVAGRFRLISAREDDVWAHPVIHHGRLYLRYHEALHSYDLRPQ